jgi:outer membrane immunogenic protein
MRRIACVTFLIFAAASAASAADMPVKAPLRAAPVFNWNGFYAGGNVGYGWGTYNSVTTDTTGAVVGTGSVNPSGWLGGAQIGYNWMFANSWLLGVEGDFSVANLNDVQNTPVATGGSRGDWFATARGRLGYAVNNWLVYGTGGAAWLHEVNHRTVAPALPAAGETASPALILNGWTLGGGVEVGVTSNWTARLEYLYMNFPSGSFDFTYSVPVATRHVAVSMNTNVVRLGINYLFNGN